MNARPIDVDHRDGALDSILSYVEADANGCWLWTRARIGTGYANVWWRGRPTLVHRLVFTFFIGPIPTGLSIYHRCRVKHCVNPQHLEAVSERINILSGNTASAINAAKTRCPSGHSYSEKNTYLNGGRKRSCRKCHAAAARRRKARARALVVAA